MHKVEESFSGLHLDFVQILSSHIERKKRKITSKVDNEKF